MRRPHRFGFTLVELLVVIGIIALLLGILLPSLSKARDSAKRATCMANLRSLGQCYYAYVNNSKGTGFFYGYGYPTSSVPAGYKTYQLFWFAGLVTYAGATAQTWDPTLGYLTPYYKNPVFQTCPSNFEYTAPYQLYGAVPLTTYAYNSSVPAYNAATGAGANRLSQLQSPVDTFALADALVVNSLGQTTGVYASLAPFTYKTPSFQGRHTGKGNVLWYDGHVTSEAPYLTNLAANLNSSNAMAAACATRGRLKIGYLTPLGHGNTPDAALMSDPTNQSVNYYYWAHKKNMN